MPMTTSRKRKRQPEIYLPGGERIWFGRNSREHGHEHYIGMIDENGAVASVRVVKHQRAQVARFFRRIANRLMPSPKRKARR